MLIFFIFIDNDIILEAEYIFLCFPLSLFGMFVLGKIPFILVEIPVL